MYIEKKIHSGFVSTLLVIVVLVLFFFHTKPSYQKSSQLATSVMQMEQEIKALSETGGLASDSELSEVEQKELSAKIPSSLEQDILITDLNRIAKTTEVNFNALAFTLQKSGDIPSVSIAAGFQGTSANLVRFLDLLEANQRKFVVKDASYAKATTKDGIEVVNLNVTLQAFYRQDKPAL